MINTYELYSLCESFYLHYRTPLKTPSIDVRISDYEYEHDVKPIYERAEKVYDSNSEMVTLDKKCYDLVFTARPEPTLRGDIYEDFLKHWKYLFFDVNLLPELLEKCRVNVITLKDNGFRIVPTGVINQMFPAVGGLLAIYKTLSTVTGQNITSLDNVYGFMIFTNIINFALNAAYPTMMDNLHGIAPAYMRSAGLDPNISMSVYTELIFNDIMTAMNTGDSMAVMRSVGNGLRFYNNFFPGDLSFILREGSYLRNTLTTTYTHGGAYVSYYFRKNPYTYIFLGISMIMGLVIQGVFDYDQSVFNVGVHVSVYSRMAMYLETIMRELDRDFQRTYNRYIVGVDEYQHYGNTTHMRNITDFVEWSFEEGKISCSVLQSVTRPIGFIPYGQTYDAFGIKRFKPKCSNFKDLPKGLYNVDHIKITDKGNRYELDGDSSMEYYLNQTYNINTFVQSSNDYFTNLPEVVYTDNYFKYLHALLVRFHSFRGYISEANMLTLSRVLDYEKHGSKVYVIYLQAIKELLKKNNFDEDVVNDMVTYEMFPERMIMFDKYVPVITRALNTIFTEIYEKDRTMDGAASMTYIKTLREILMRRFSDPGLRATLTVVGRAIFDTINPVEIAGWFTRGDKIPYEKIEDEIFKLENGNSENIGTIEFLSRLIDGIRQNEVEQNEQAVLDRGTLRLTLERFSNTITNTVMTPKYIVVGTTDAVVNTVWTVQRWSSNSLMLIAIAIFLRYLGENRMTILLEFLSKGFLKRREVEIEKNDVSLAKTIVRGVDNNGIRDLLHDIKKTIHNELKVPDSDEVLKRSTSLYNTQQSAASRVPNHTARIQNILKQSTSASNARPFQESSLSMRIIKDHDSSTNVYNTGNKEEDITKALNGIRNRIGKDDNNVLMEKLDKLAWNKGIYFTSDQHRLKDELYKKLNKGVVPTNALIQTKLDVKEWYDNHCGIYKLYINFTLLKDRLSLYVVKDDVISISVGNQLRNNYGYLITTINKIDSILKNYENIIFESIDNGFVSSYTIDDILYRFEHFDMMESKRMNEILANIDAYKGGLELVPFNIDLVRLLFRYRSYNTFDTISTTRERELASSISKCIGSMLNKMEFSQRGISVMARRIHDHVMVLYNEMKIRSTNKEFYNRFEKIAALCRESGLSIGGNPIKVGDEKALDMDKMIPVETLWKLNIQIVISILDNINQYENTESLIVIVRKYVDVI